jgi:hypothetical protein
VHGDTRAAVTEHAEHGVDVVKVRAAGGFATPETDKLGAPVHPHAVAFRGGRR